jgi:hypothetical protein
MGWGWVWTQLTLVGNEVVSSVVSSSDMQLLAANGNLGQRADFLLPMRGPYFSSDGGAVNGEMLRSGEANSGSVG